MSMRNRFEVLQLLLSPSETRFPWFGNLFTLSCIMPGRSSTDAIFILRQTMEKHREGRKNIGGTFIDLEKTYDRVSMEDITRKCNALEKYLN